ncbi:hypothetical protein RJG79_01730 [Mycoplasmatota bacterium WC44]
MSLIKFDKQNYIDKIKFRVDIDNFDFGDGNDRIFIYNLFKRVEFTEGIEAYNQWDYGDYVMHLKTKNGRISLHKEGKSVLIEINPLNYDREDISHFIISRILSRAKISPLKKQDKYMRSITILRLDFKQDHLVNLAEYTPISNLKKEWILKRSNLIETLYIGSRESNYMYRIYNKGKELGFDTPIPMWRLEAEIKGDFDIFGWLVSDCEFDPFSKLELYKKEFYTFNDIDNLILTKAEKSALYTSLNANRPLKQFISKNKIANINKQLKTLKMSSEKFEINRDISHIKKALEYLLFRGSIEELLDLGI